MVCVFYHCSFLKEQGPKFKKMFTKPTYKKTKKQIGNIRDRIKRKLGKGRGREREREGERGRERREGGREREREIIQQTDKYDKK